MLRYNYTTLLILFLSLFINSCISDTIENNSINYESKDINVIKEKINFVLTNHYNYNGNKFSINDTSSGCIDLDKCSLLGTYTDTINITGYGDCKAVVQWDQYWCYRDLNPGMSGSIEFDNFTAYPLAGSCDSVFMAWYNYETNNMLEQLEEDLTAFVYSAQETIRHRELGIFFENLKPFIECGIGNFLLSTRVFTSNCKKNCYKLT